MTVFVSKFEFELGMKRLDIVAVTNLVILQRIRKDAGFSCGQLSHALRNHEQKRKEVKQKNPSRSFNQ